ncbi:MAG: hypothetical protein DRJ97_02635 [Thermoprotei archaeon]|nr:MAG: hypothetical protein DRJ97_02635 [Thermoprotei archaeon]
MALQATICTGCSLLCDDVEVEVKDGEVLKVMAACSHGVKRMKEVVKARPLKPAVVDGGSIRELSLDEALERACELLKSSRSPLIYGGSCSSNRAVELMIKLAEKLGGVYDAPSSVCHLTLNLDSSLLEARLDEILEDADFIFYWASDPSDTHLRHASRYAVFPRGRSVPMGRESRVVAVMDVKETGTMKIAQHKLIVKPGEDAKLASALESLVLGGTLGFDRVAGVSLEELSSTARDMSRASYIAIFVGRGLLSTDKPKEAMDSIARLAKVLLGLGKKVSIIPMAEHVNSMGQALITKKLKGAPRAIDFSSPEGRASLEVTANWALEHKKVDAALIIKGGGLEDLTSTAIEELSRIPAIALEEEESKAFHAATVRVPAAVTGVESGGAVTRMDGVEVELKPIMRPPDTVAVEEEFLDRLVQML